MTKEPQVILIQAACKASIVRVKDEPGTGQGAEEVEFANLGEALFWLGALAAINEHATEPLLAGLAWARDRMEAGHVMTEPPQAGRSAAAERGDFVWIRMDGETGDTESLESLARSLYESRVAGLTVPGPLLAALALAEKKE